jgi:hypothetical protein
MFQALSSQILTNLGELEGDYRAFHLKNDIAQSILSFSIASISMLAMLRSDSFFFKDTPDLFMLMAGSRIIYFLITIFVMIVTLKTTKVRTFDR